MKNSYSGTDATYEEPRGTVEETVDFMVGLLDEAASNLPWTVEEAWDGRFTKAAAEALKCKILLFAASPLFNSETPCAGSEADAANANHQAWYGDYKAERWQRCLTACEKFFQGLRDIISWYRQKVVIQRLDSIVQLSVQLTLSVVLPRC